MTRSLARRRFGAPGLVALVLIVVGATLSMHPAQANASSRAGVVVDLGNGQVHNVGISFAAAITGIEALQAAGFAPSTRSFGGLGGAVCALDVGGTTLGCPTDGSCLTCAQPAYWVYFRAPAGTSQFVQSRAGAGATQVHDGDIEGWRWGTGAPPPYAAIDTFFTSTTTTTVPHTTTLPPSPTTTTRVAPPTTAITTGMLGTPTTATTIPSSPATTNRTSLDTVASARTTTAADIAGVATTNSLVGAPQPNGDRSERRAAGPPVVSRSGGANGTAGLIAFALLVVVLAASIVGARVRRRTRGAA